MYVLNANIAIFFLKWKKSIPCNNFSNCCSVIWYGFWLSIVHEGQRGENEVILIIQNPVFPFCSRSTVIMCPSLSSFSLDHGKWKIVNGSHYEFGTRIIFTCNPGYYRVGPAHIQCLANGVWSWRNERPRCKSKRLFTAATKKRKQSIFVCLSPISKFTLL